MRVSEQLIDYAVKAVRRTREDDAILVGAGHAPRQALLRAARAWAASPGAISSAPTTFARWPLPVLEHRLIAAAGAEMEGVRMEEALDRILHEVPVPR